MKVRTDEQRSGEGLDAYRQLQAAFDPHNTDIAELRAAGVAERRIKQLYPLDFAAYLPLLHELLDDWVLAKDAVEKCYAGGKLSADRLALAGIDSDSLDEFYEEFVTPDSNTLDSLFTTALASYTENLSVWPMPTIDRTELEQAHAEVQYLLDNLALSAWLLENWEQALVLGEGMSWMDPALARKLLVQDVLDVTLNFFERVWAPLIERATA